MNVEEKTQNHSEKQVKSSDAKAFKCHLKFSSRMIIFIKLVQYI